MEVCGVNNGVRVLWVVITLPDGACENDRQEITFS